MSEKTVIVIAEDQVAAQDAVDLVTAKAYDHPYTCDCDECLTWWAKAGPDPDEPEGENYGPFTKDQVRKRREEISQ